MISCRSAVLKAHAQVSGISFTYELTRNVNSQALLQAVESGISRVGPEICV